MPKENKIKIKKNEAKTAISFIVSKNNFKGFMGVARKF